MEEELVEGQSYALEMTRPENCLRVILVSTEADHYSKVIVRKYDGDEELEVPRGRLLGTWNSYRGQQLAMVSTDAFYGVAWIPDVGEEVERSDAPGRWRVEEIDVAADRVLLRGELLTLPREEAVRLDQLHRVSDSDNDYWVEGKAKDHLEFVEPQNQSQAQEEASYEVSDDPAGFAKDGSIEPTAIADRLIFASRACDQYRQLEPRCKRGEEANRLRSELRQKGRLHRRPKRREYICYRVPGRFEIVLFESPSRTDGDIWVESIAIAPWRLQKPAKHRPRTERSKRGKRPERKPSTRRSPRKPRSKNRAGAGKPT